MDINDNNFQDYFGFGAYPRHQRSNLDFLNFSVEDTDEYKTLTSEYQKDTDSLRAEYFAKADALGYSDSVKAQKDAIYAELERKLKTRKIKYDAAVALLKVNQKAGQAQTRLESSRGLLDVLGIHLPSSSKPAEVEVKQQDKNGQDTKPNYTPLYIGLGVVAIGLVGFVVYKMSK